MENLANVTEFLEAKDVLFTMTLEGSTLEYLMSLEWLVQLGVWFDSMGGVADYGYLENAGNSR